METRSCPACGGLSRAEVASVGHRHIVRCAHCHLLYADRYDPSAMDEIYGAYFARDPDPADAPIWNDLCALIRGSEKTDAISLLDIGAGRGGLLQTLRTLEPQAGLTAIEPHPQARETLAARVPGLRFLEGTAEAFDPQGETFSCIAMLSTLEHLRDPLAACIAARKALAPGGRLLLTVPNCQSFRVLLRGTDEPFCFGNPTHLQFFSDADMRVLLTRAGFGRTKRIVRLGGTGTRGPAALLQWLLRRLGFSSELRYLAWSGDADQA